jgi:predicted  nucleic acid-binding Zn-ribbon protein
MSDMNGAKLAMTNGEGHTVEYEIVRVGTMAEYRRLLKDSETHAVATKTREKELHEMSGRMRIAESHSSEVEAELAALKEAISARKKRAADLFAKLDGGKSLLSQTIEEMIGVIDEVHGE